MDENILKKPLESLTLKECQEICQNTYGCFGCPLAGYICGDTGMSIPGDWVWPQKDSNT